MKPIDWLRNAASFFLGNRKGSCAVQRYAAGGGRLERAEDVQQRALAGTRRPHDGGGVAALERKVDAVKGWAAGRGASRNPW